MRTVGDKVLVKPEMHEQLGQFIIPDRYQKASSIGQVVSIGTGSTPDGKVVPFVVKSGERILYDVRAGTEVKINGDLHIVIAEKDIFGIIE